MKIPIKAIVIALFCKNISHYHIDSKYSASYIYLVLSAQYNDF